MKTNRMILSPLFFLIVAIFMTEPVSAQYDMDADNLTISGEGYVLGVSNDGESMMLMRILDTAKVSDPEIRHRIHADAVWLADALDLKEFSAVFGDDEDLFQDRISRKLNDLMIFEKIGKGDDDFAPSLVRFFTEEDY